MPNRIKEHRQRLGWSQEKLAAEVETSTQQISRLEKSQRRLDDEWLERLARAMSVTKADILADAFSVPGRAPSDSDVVKDSRERTLLDFWRRLPSDAQDVIFNIADGWASRIIRRSDDDR